jgi:tetratricopeptide (TPR) repeat protein
MKLVASIAAFAMLSLPALAQRKQYTIDASTPEGRILQMAGQEEDVAKKTTLLEDFVARYPQHEGFSFACDQLVPIYVKAGQLDKALALADKAIAADPEDLDTAIVSLKGLEANKDPDNVKKWSAITSGIARKTINGQKPADADADEWKQKVDYAKQVDTYCEYALYAAALASQNPVKTGELVEALEQRNPQSQYLGQSYGPYFRALVQSKNTDKAVAVAEKLMAANQADEDMTLMVADYNFNKQQQPDKVIAAAARTVEILNTKAAPAGVDGAAWDKAKNTKIGVAHWYEGMTYANQSKFAQADTELRASLPLIEGNEILKGGALFTLGLANFKMGDTAKPDTKRIQDALRFSQQSAAIKSPWQPMAAKNVAAIRGKYRMQ